MVYMNVESLDFKTVSKSTALSAYFYMMTHEIQFHLCKAGFKTLSSEYKLKRSHKPGVNNRRSQSS